MFARAIAPTARLVAQRPALLASRLGGPTPATALALSSSLLQKRAYANQPAGTSEHAGSPVTSTSHPTVPKAPPKPTAFFARKNIGLEVTPLMAFVGTIVTVAIGFLVHAYLTDDTVAHRHGVPDDPALKKIIGDPKRAEETGQRK
ncbi:hypothetical protein JCM10908_003926 [Rhodotorula pacifica]|uniref:uncharacterized protein n=1 Tax=Rhodotorula pacifica TaxID=1495444 RepID=UPI00317C5A55